MAIKSLWFYQIFSVYFLNIVYNCIAFDCAKKWPMVVSKWQGKISEYQDSIATYHASLIVWKITIEQQLTRKYFIVVTWARVICLKCMPSVLGLRPRTFGIHFRQITNARVTTIMQHFLRLIALMPIRIRPLGSLYMHTWKDRLWLCSK